MLRNKISLAGLAETHTYNNNCFADKIWDWHGGAETRPALGHLKSKGGIGIMVDRGLVFSIVKSGTFSMWSQIEIKGGSPIFVAECYFPNNFDSKSHKQAWEEIESCCLEFRNLGHLLIMGDLNTHIGLDKSRIAVSGRLMLSRVLDLNLNFINGTPTCKGNTTRSEERTDGSIITSTIDSVLVSDSLLPHVESMTIDDDRMRSDHHPIVIEIRNLVPSGKTDVYTSGLEN